MRNASVGYAAGETPGSALMVRSVARSHVGLVRTINEDRVFDCPEARMWAVVDGMGGHCGGDVAAQMVVDRLRALVLTGTALNVEAMMEALNKAHRDVRDYNHANGIDAGATVVAMLVVDDIAHIVWAGDSRAYRWRPGMLDRLTHDHSLVQELVDAGLLTEDAAERHPQSHIVTRALGAHAESQLETTTIKLRPGDRLLLCSDGLSRSLNSADMDDRCIGALADALIANALMRDGNDNVSMTLVEVC